MGQPGLRAAHVHAHEPVSAEVLIYLDHHATTPVDRRVADEVYRAMVADFGNANSADHILGDSAAAEIVRSAGEVAALVGGEADWVTFTSGASHGLRLALAHARSGRPGAPLRLAISRVEHRSLIDAAEDLARVGSASIEWIEVDERARLRPESLESALRRADLLCIMSANNEVGTIYPIAEIARAAKEAGVSLLVDASQGAGRVPIDARGWDLDYLILTAHKMYGPKGVGALVSPLISQRDLRGLPYAWEGTENVPGIVGLGESCRLRRLEMSIDEPRIARLRDRLEALLVERIRHLVVNGDRDHRLSENLHLSVPGAPNDQVTARLRRTVAISTGAACSSGTDTPSHVLQAMGLPEELQESALRIGLGKFNTEDEVVAAAETISDAIECVRAGGGAFA